MPIPNPVQAAQIVAAVGTTTKKVIDGVNNNKYLAALENETQNIYFEMAKGEMEAALRLIKKNDLTHTHLDVAEVHFRQARGNFHALITAERKALPEERRAMTLKWHCSTAPKDSGKFAKGFFAFAGAGVALCNLSLRSYENSLENIANYPLAARNLAAFYATKCYFNECLIAKCRGDNINEIYFNFKNDFRLYNKPKFGKHEYSCYNDNYAENEYKSVYLKTLEKSGFAKNNLNFFIESNWSHFDGDDKLLYWLTHMSLLVNEPIFWDYIYKDNDYMNDYYVSASLDDKKGIGKEHLESVICRDCLVPTSDYNTKSWHLLLELNT
jgi:hypothetical protein